MAFNIGTETVSDLIAAFKTNQPLLPEVDPITVLSFGLTEFVQFRVFSEFSCNLSRVIDEIDVAVVPTTVVISFRGETHNHFSRTD
jgi:hypothetical protein